MAAHPKAYKPLRAPRGTRLQTKGWSQEGALRMMMNNLDPEVGGEARGAHRLRRDGKSRPELGCFLGHRRQPEKARKRRNARSSSRANRWPFSRPMPRRRAS